MKTILMTAYAVNPNKGSEDGMGWNYITAAARHNIIIAVTRRNNREDIEQYMKADNANVEVYSRISFMYFDWPQWMIIWKKGPMLSMVYYYMWQMTLAVWLLYKRPVFDIAHNLNFHNDWTPSFLWMTGKPFVWGPVGHHPKIEKRFLKPYSCKELFKDRLLWLLKLCFWNFDPFLYITKKTAKHIWCMHMASAEKLRLSSSQYFLHPSVAVRDVEQTQGRGNNFLVLSIGRFVPLKGFDITIRSFAKFYHALPAEGKASAKLLLIGKGPLRASLDKLIVACNVCNAVTVLDWMPQQELKEIYGQASVFLFPSHEGAGMVVAEAMSCSLPVLCWDNAGPGTITHSASTLKVPYGEYENSVLAFADNLLRLYSSPALMSSEKELSRKRFLKALDLSQKSEQLSAFYNQSALVRDKTIPKREKQDYCNTLTE